MSWEIPFVLIVIFIMMATLFLEVARPDLIVFGTLMLFLITGVLSSEEALQGFANEGMLTVALLFIIAGAIQKSGIFDRMLAFLLGSGSSPRGAMFKMMAPVAGMSAFLNNTPIVAAFTPSVRKWCEDRNISPSKFLIPLSYITILGGTITLMGTSTNLIVHGMLLEEGLGGFSIFQLAWVGIPIAILGLFYLLTIGYKLLPDHKNITETFQEQSREYLAEMIVEDSHPHIGKTVEQAGLRNLKGLFLIEIIRGTQRVFPVKSTTIIESGDRLIFTGAVQTIAELQHSKGLRLKPGADLSLDILENGNTQLVEVVISHQSSLLHKKLETTKFRGLYDAAVIAVRRNHERIEGKIGDIILKPGDTLLLLAGTDFSQRKGLNSDFYVVTPMKNPFLSKVDVRKGFFTVAILVIMIALVTFEVFSMFEAMGIAVVVLFATRVITPGEAKKSVQLNVLLLIASAIGIGAALEVTGAATWVASGLVQFGEPFGMLAVLFLVYLMTNTLTEMITNNAAAVLMFTIAISAAEQIGANPMAFAVVVAIAASASFITPIGYQTNLIVYGPGGYKFTDYAKVGFPLSIIVMVTTLSVVNVVWL